MRRSLAVLSSFLLVVGFSVPAQSSGNTPKPYQKTLSTFSGNSTTLTAAQRNQIREAVEANPNAEKFICTGIRFATQPMSVNIMVRKRAKAACEYAKQLNPNLSTWFQNKPTQARSYAGKVLLTVKNAAGSSTAAERTDGNQSGYMTEGPEAWLNVTAQVPGGKCSVEGTRAFPANTNPLECRRTSLRTLRWVEDSSISRFSTAKNVANPKLGTTCFRLGEQIKNSAGLLECRYVAGMKLKFVQLSGSNDAPLNAAGLSSVEMCKIQDQRSRIGGGGSTAFPMKHNRISANGILDVAIIPIDFPDGVAPVKPMELLEEHLEMLNQRNEDIFGNRIKYRWHVPDSWLRMSKSAENYNQDHATVQPDGSRKFDGTKTLLTADEQLTEIYTAAEKVLDIEAMDYFVLFSNPYEPDVQFGPGYINDIRTATKTYRGINSYPIGYFSFNGHFIRNGVSLFDMMAHEIQHAQGMVQHAPGNGTQWYGGIPSTWESWVAGWRPDSQIACVDATKGVDASVSLSSMDLPSAGYKSVVVRVSSTEVLVVESRRDGLYNPAFAPGFAGISVYNVDATKEGDRWDGNTSKEKDYYAYFLRNDRGSYPNLRAGPNLGDMNAAGFEGDSFSYRGIKITLIDSGDYDTIKIESASGASPLSQEDTDQLIKLELLCREPESFRFCPCASCTL
jgi:hypothetical protein